MSKETILVVDDEQFARAAVTKVLAASGYKVHSVSSGQEAIDFAINEPFDVLLTDFRMPGGLDGLTTVRAVQNINPQVVAIMMTAHNTVDLAVQSLNLGVHGFVIKPFTTHDLLKTVQQTLERQRLIRENTQLRALNDVYATSQALISANTEMQSLPQLALALALEETRSSEAYLFFEATQGAKELHLVQIGLNPERSDDWFSKTKMSFAAEKLLNLTEYFDFPDPTHYELTEKLPLKELLEKAERVMTERYQLLLIDGVEVSSEPGLMIPVQKESCTVFVPMMVQQRTIGVLVIRRVQTGHTYNDVDLQTATLLAGQAAIAIENGRLFTSLARVEALREADRLRSEFVSTVSHELRTPLTSIKGYATTLLREDFNWSAQTGQEYLGIISDECDKLMELIDNILEVSKIEAGVLRIRPETTQIYHVIERAVSETLRRNPELDLNFSSPPAEELPFVRADSHRIIQVLRNLIGNSIKYSPEGAHITVKIEPLKAEQPSRVLISVADKGIGLKPEDQNRVFERFYRVDTGPARRTEGTGLGLAICRGIIEAHNGQIWVESEGVGKGSKFYFTLPVVELSELVFLD